MKEWNYIARLQNDETQHSEDSGVTMVTYGYDGKEYTGVAFCHDGDMTFYSPKVGRTIASARAKEHILQDKVKMLQQEVKAKKAMYAEATRCADADPTGAFKKSLENSERRLKKFRQALKHQRAWLRAYLKDQQFVIDAVRAMRSKDEVV